MASSSIESSGADMTRPPARTSDTWPSLFSGSTPPVAISERTGRAGKAGDAPLVAPASVAGTNNIDDDACRRLEEAKGGHHGVDFLSAGGPGLSKANIRVSETQTLRTRVLPKVRNRLPNGPNCSGEKVLDIITAIQDVSGALDNAPPHAEELLRKLCLAVSNPDVWKAAALQEISHLMHFARNVDIPLQLETVGFFKDVGTKEEYRRLTMLCNVLQAVLKFCRLEFECLRLMGCAQTNNMNKVLALLKQAREWKAVVTQDERFQTLRGEKETRRTLSQLIGFLSKLLTRLVIQSSPSDYWQQNVLAAVTWRVVTMKHILSDEGTTGAWATLDQHELWNIQEEQGRESAEYSDDNELDMEDEELANARGQRATSTFLERCEVQSALDDAFQFILASLTSHETTSSGLSPTAFDIIAISETLQNGLTGCKSLTYQDKQLQYSGSSDKDMNSTSHSAFVLLNHTVEQIWRQQTRPVGHLAQQSANRATVQWAFVEAKEGLAFDFMSAHDFDSITLDSMDKISTVMAAHSLVNPVFLSSWTSFRHKVAMTGSILDDVAPPEPGHFTAVFRLYTDEFTKLAKSDDVASLSYWVQNSQDLVQHQHQDQEMPSVEEGSYVAETVIPFLNGIPLRHMETAMDQWVFDENSVTVKCELYVWTVITIALLLTLGGLGIGFSVGERINGVDPSNLATYLWVVAAFFVLVCKSIHVKDWAWNDFLNRRVRCTSVTELHSVTGIDPRPIIARLLSQDTADGTFTTRGPYNAVFRNRSSSGTGFSIDVPVSSGTLWLCGITMLKVTTAKGHAMVFLDGRTNNGLQVVKHRPVPGVEYLVCEDLDRAKPSRSNTFPTQEPDYEDVPWFRQLAFWKWGWAQRRAKIWVDDSPRLRLTRTSTLKWKSVQGLYTYTWDRDMAFV